MTIRISGTKELTARLEAIKPSPALMRQLAVATVAEQKRLVPRKTGNLARSIGIARVTSTQADVVAGANYAAAVEFGTREHDIPRNRGGKVLRFGVGGVNRLSGTPRTGTPRAKNGSSGVVFARRVRHPGTRAQPFMVPGARKAYEMLSEIITRLWNGAA